MAKASSGVRARVYSEGGANVVRQGLGEMPLTLWLVVAGAILALYLRRAHLGIDKHPGESVTLSPGKRKPSVFIGPRRPSDGFLPSDSGGGGNILAPFASDSGGGGSIK